MVNKNIVSLDIMMGLTCIVCAFTIVGLLFVPFVLETWEDMRGKAR